MLLLNILTFYRIGAEYQASASDLISDFFFKRLIFHILYIIHILYLNITHLHIKLKPVNIGKGGVGNRFKGILHQKMFSCLNLIFWIVMGCGIARFGGRGLKTNET